MEFIVKKTTELSEEQIRQVCELFEEVFEGSLKSPETFREEFCNTVLGYSFHGLIVEQGRIVGSHSMVPVTYMADGKEVVWGVTGDTMVKKEYRNFLNILDLVETAEDYMKASGIDFIFGFPNDNAYPVFTKALSHVEIGRLDTYILPCRIGGIKPRLKALNFLSMFFSRFLLLASRLNSGGRVHRYRIDKQREDFYANRLKWFGGNYEKVRSQGFTFVYKVTVYEGIRTAFLLDLDNVSKRNFNGSVRHIFRKEKERIDAVIYVGRLPFTSWSMIRVPRKFEPKRFYFTGRMLGKETDPGLVMELGNWNVNLSCYDLI